MRENKTMKSLSLMMKNILRTTSALLLAVSALIVPASLLAANKGPDSGGYSATDATVYSFIDISGPGGGASVLSNADDSTAALTLPFSFGFYGTNYTLVCVSSNGALYFVPDANACTAVGTANDFANTDLTVAGTPNDLPAVLPLWSDLTFQQAGGGSVYYQSFGAVGSRRFVVQWSNVFPQGSASAVTFQVVLAETTNSITVQYQTVTLGGGNPASNGAQATVGIRNSGAVSNGQQIPWSYNVGVLSNSYAILFTSGGAPSAPVLTAPANGGASVNTPVTLSWAAAAGATSYDVYFGITSPPALVTNTVATSYIPAGVSLGTSYNWQVVAKNASGSSASPIWSFTTGAVPCTYSLDSPSATFTSAGGTGSFNVTAPGACAWTVTGTPAWVTITAGASGTGNGPVNYTVGLNSGAALAATLSIGGQTYSITQTAAPAGGGGGGGSTPTAPTIFWTTPSPITYGIPLGATQLNAGASTPGTFIYSPPAGTILSAGTQTLSAVFTPASPNFTSASSAVSLVVNRAAQTLTFGALADRTTDTATLSLTGTTSSGLAPVFSVISGPATVNGSTLTITGLGTITVRASQAGNINYLAATPVNQSFSVTLGSANVGAIVNAATYANVSLVADAYGVVFGKGFSIDTAQATSATFPTTLAGVTVTITDVNGKSALALLYYVSRSQINFVMPKGLATGTAIVTVNNVIGKAGTFSTNIGTIAPAFFTADASGKGTAASVAVSITPDGATTVLCGVSVACTAPIDVSSTTASVYLSLYGTGIRNLQDAAAVTVAIGGVPAKVTYAGAQPTFPGLDQVNVLLDRSLAGKGTLDVVVTIDGIAANTVQINIK